MGTPATERQRRSRAHRKGDHSLCDTERCDGSAVTPVTVVLGVRGRRLWADLTKTEPDPTSRVLIEEICRLADRLDRLDAVLNGSAAEWVTFRTDEGGDRVTVVVDKALSEARQQAVALKQLLAELRQAAGQVGGDSAGEVDVFDQLAAARARRLADASGS